MELRAEGWLKGGSFVWQPLQRSGAAAAAAATDATEAKTCQRSMGSRKRFGGEGAVIPGGGGQNLMTAKLDFEGGRVHKSSSRTKPTKTREKGEKKYKGDEDEERRTRTRMQTGDFILFDCLISARRRDQRPVHFWRSRLKGLRRSLKTFSEPRRDLNGNLAAEGSQRDHGLAWPGLAWSGVECSC